MQAGHETEFPFELQTESNFMLQWISDKFAFWFGAHVSPFNCKVHQLKRHGLELWEE